MNHALKDLRQDATFDVEDLAARLDGYDRRIAEMDPRDVAHYVEHESHWLGEMRAHLGSLEIAARRLRERLEAMR